LGPGNKKKRKAERAASLTRAHSFNLYGVADAKKGKKRKKGRLGINFFLARKERRNENDKPDIRSARGNHGWDEKGEKKRGTAQFRREEERGLRNRDHEVEPSKKEKKRRRRKNPARRTGEALDFRAAKDRKLSDSVNRNGKGGKAHCIWL